MGKTVLLRQVIQALLAQGINAKRILYVPFDELPTFRGIKEPVLAIARWHERIVLKQNYVDNHGVRALITGSSSLRIEAGRDSLAGRIATLDIGPLLLREIAELRYGVARISPWVDNGLHKLMVIGFWKNAAKAGKDDKEIRDKAFKAFSDRGGFPIAQQRHDIPWPELADYLNETVIRRAILHDLRMGPRGQKRDEKLLEEVFRLCCRYAGQAAGQSAFIPEIQQALAGNIGWNRVLTYLRFLDGTLLVRLVPPIELRLIRKNSPVKLCLSDHTLRASWLQEVVPLDPAGLAENPHVSDLAGHLAESTLGYFLSSIPNLDVSHFPARGAEPEVDFVITIGTRRIPIEVKYRKRIDPLNDTVGLRAFIEKTVYNAPFGLLVTLDDDVEIPDPRIIPISLSSFLWIK